MIALFDRLDGVDAAKVDASLLMPNCASWSRCLPPGAERRFVDQLQHSLRV
jgi:hypothetical protein